MNGSGRHASDLSSIMTPLSILRAALTAEFQLVSNLMTFEFYFPVYLGETAGLAIYKSTINKGDLTLS